MFFKCFHQQVDSVLEIENANVCCRLTLSERFGKMAQWSLDRSARLENMRITRRETTLHVRIERDEREPEPPAEHPTFP